MSEVNLNWTKLFEDTKAKFGGQGVPEGMTLYEIDKEAVEELLNKQTFEDSDPLKIAVMRLK